MTHHPPLPPRDAIRDWVEDNSDRFDPDGDLDVFVDAVHQAVANKHIGQAVRTARLIRKVTIGTGYFDPVYPYHGAVRPCPHCDQVYRVHGGHADHRDRCPENPINKDNPERVTDGGAPQVKACPECDATDFQTRRPGHPSSNLPADAPRFRCYDCGHAFDEPVERPGERPGLVGAAKVLDELDADDIATDGGVPAERPPEPRPCPDCGYPIDACECAVLFAPRPSERPPAMPTEEPTPADGETGGQPATDTDAEDGGGA